MSNLVKEHIVKENIIITAENLFIRYGFKRVTMDDIAREMAISKKTIYQFFKDKNEIVCSATEYHLQKECSDIKLLEEQSENVIEYLVKLCKQMRGHIKVVHPGAIEDLKKYFPEAWGIFIRYKKEVFLESLENTLKRGVEEGYFHPDIRTDILAVMRMEQIQMSWDENIFPRAKYDCMEVQMQILRHFIAGIITEKGRELLKAYSNSVDTNEIYF